LYQLLLIRSLSLLAFATAVAIHDGCSYPVFAAAEIVEDHNSSILELTTKILLKEIALERFYLKYKILASQEPKLRDLRYFLGQQASLGLFLSGDIVTIQDSGSHLDNPARLSIPRLKSAIEVEFIGSIIGSASSAAELCSNGFIAWKNCRHKQNPASAQLAMKTRLQEINDLLARREQLVSLERSSPVYDILCTEGQLMQFYRDACVAEFAQIYADVKSYQASDNVFYFLSAASNSIFSVAAGLAYNGFANQRYISPSIVTGIIGDGIGIISAPASFMAKKLLFKHYSKKIYKNLEERPYDVDKASANVLEQLRQHVFKLDDSILSQVGPIRVRLAAYDLYSSRYDEYISREMERLRRYEKIALQSVFFGPIISSTFLAQDLLGASAYYGNKNRLKTANNLTFSGAITAGAGSALGLGATSWYFLDETLNQRELKREGKLPEQLLQQRLKTLDEIELMIGQPTKSN